MSNVSLYIANSRKAIIQFATLVITIATGIASYNILPAKYAALIPAVIGFAGTILHYVTPNADAPGTVVAKENDDGSYGVSTLPPADVAPLVDANGDDVPNEEPEDHELDEGPIVNEIPVVPSVTSTRGKHEA